MNIRSCLAALSAAVLAIGAFASPSVEPKITFYTPEIVRVIRAPGGAVVKRLPVVTALPGEVDVKFAEDAASKSWSSSAVTVRLDRKTNALSFIASDGTTLLAEQASAEFEDAGYTRGYKATRVTQRWLRAKDAPVYGLGSLQNDRLDQRQVEKYCLQPMNRDDGIPVLAAPEGWGLYWDNMSVTHYVSDDTTVGFRSDVGDDEDYYFIAAGSLDGVAGAMRHLTGRVPMNALWSYGFWQSRERYMSQKDVLDVLRRYRRDGIPMDGIVQDWQYWGGNDHWNALDFLSKNFSQPKAMLDEIHAAHCHFIISIWSCFGPKTKPYADLARIGGLLDLPTWPGGSKPFDAYNPLARKIYWKHAEKLYDYGIDGWWMDSTEPELGGKYEDSQNDITCAAGRYRDVRLGYPLCTIGNIHDNTKAHAPDRRVFILTRSATAGLQRTGAQVWSGDTASTWEDLAKQIPCGLNFMLSGNPNWSGDIGGFFGRNKSAFPELYVRWMQYGVFQPMMRSHGTGFWRELYDWGKPGQPVYDSLLASIKLRYRFLPRVYSLAHKTYAGNGSFMRPTVADFPKDRRTWDQKRAFLFGHDMLVAPVTASNVTEVATYLPEGATWYNYFTRERVEGGREHVMKVDYMSFPLYVKAGTVQVDGPDVQYVGEKPWDDMPVTVYPGADGSFDLYEDAGDGYAYEKGESTTIRFTWNDKAKKLTVGAREGAYPGMLKARRFRVKMLGGAEKTVEYNGKQVEVRF